MKDNFDFKIVDKNGKIVEDVSFKDYDQLADYMLNVADQWYQGLRNPDDQYTLTQKTADGSIKFEEQNTFGVNDEVSDNGAEIADAIRILEQKVDGIREAYGSDS